MKLYKKIDFGIQVTMILFFIFYTVANPNNFFYGYFIVGGWQVLSSLIHAAVSPYYFPIKGRKYYCWTLIGLFITGLATIYLFFLFGYFLLFVSPFLALWYAWICYKEIQRMEHKEFVHLK